MVAINQVTPPLLAGCVVSCGAVLAVAGAGKLFRAARGRGGAARPSSGCCGCHRRTGCTDEFWFTAAGPGRRAVVFEVSQAAPGGRPAVHASLRDGPARPSRAGKDHGKGRTSDEIPADA